MNKLENWIYITKGLYRYIISTNTSYEIHVLYHLNEDNILLAKASLFLVGNWKSKFERQCILKNQPVFECLESATKYYEEFINTNNVNNNN